MLYKNTYTLNFANTTTFSSQNITVFLTQFLNHTKTTISIKQKIVRVREMEKHFHV